MVDLGPEACCKEQIQGAPEPEPSTSRGAGLLSFRRRCASTALLPQKRPRPDAHSALEREKFLRVSQHGGEHGLRQAGDISVWWTRTLRGSKPATHAPAELDDRSAACEASARIELEKTGSMRLRLRQQHEQSPGRSCSQPAQSVRCERHHLHAKSLASTQRSASMPSKAHPHRNATWQMSQCTPSPLPKPYTRPNGVVIPQKRAPCKAPRLDPRHQPVAKTRTA